jgi:hypothetical protein
MKRFSGLIYLFVCISIISFIGYSCANIIPPTGGLRDSLPPVLIHANPKDSTLNFAARRIEFTFDEYVDLKDVTTNTLFNPLFERPSEVNVRLKTVTVLIRDTLQPNTTYTFNFGNAITDVNENNPLKNFTYTFSTGSYIDSLELEGRVLLAEDGKIDSTLTVVLHSDLSDSAVVNKKPRYAARLDSAGRFRFTNLPKATYAVYAIGEAGFLRRYTNPTQYFAFADTFLVAGSTPAVTLYAYKEEDKRPARASVATTTRAADRRLRYTSNLANNQQDLLSDLILRFDQPLRNFDSTKLGLFTDSVFTPVSGYTITLDTSQKSIQIKTKWTEGRFYHLIIDSTFAEDTLGRKFSKADTVHFATKKTTDYGELEIRIRNMDTSEKAPVLQFVQNNNVVFSVPIKSGIYSQRLFAPGDYDLRILYDRNGNGKWDPGRFFDGHVQPEIAVPLREKIVVKPDYDNEFERAL